MNEVFLFQHKQEVSVKKGKGLVPLHIGRKGNIWLVRMEFGGGIMYYYYYCNKDYFVLYIV